MSVRSALKSIAKYFDLRAAPQDTGDYNYAVTAAKPVGVVARLADYFDLASEYRKGDKLASGIMALANAEGVAKGRFNSDGMTGQYGFSFTENDFSVRLDRRGRVLVKCDAAFAEKIAKLPLAGAVTTLKEPAVPAPQPATDAPKP